MSNFNNFNDIKKYIDEKISGAQLPDKIRGVVEYCAPFSYNQLRTTVNFKEGDVWYNTSNNIYYVKTQNYWSVGGNLIPSEGVYIYTNNYISEVNTPTDLFYQAQILWSKKLGTNNFEWKIIRDKYYSPDNFTLGLDSNGKMKILSPVLRNIHTLSKNMLGHTKGAISFVSENNDTVNVIDYENLFLPKIRPVIESPGEIGGTALKINIDNKLYYEFKNSYSTLYGLYYKETPYISYPLIYTSFSQNTSNKLINLKFSEDVLLMIGKNFIIDNYSFQPNNPDGNRYVSLGSYSNKFSKIYTKQLNDINVPDKSGTIALISDIPHALQNPNNLIITLNGGSNEGSNKIIYNGSIVKSLNITASSIGASPINHSHSNYFAKTGGTITGSVVLNNSSRLLFFTTNNIKTGELSSSGDNFLLTASNNLYLKAGSNKIVIYKNNLNNASEDGSIAPEINESLNLGNAVKRWHTIHGKYGKFDNIQAETLNLSKGATVDNKPIITSETILNYIRQDTDDVILRNPDGDSPKIYFQRGQKGSDNFTDYQIYVSGGNLKIDKIGNNSTTNMITLYENGDATYKGEKILTQTKLKEINKVSLYTESPEGIYLYNVNAYKPFFGGETITLNSSKLFEFNIDFNLVTSITAAISVSNYYSTSVTLPIIGGKLNVFSYLNVVMLKYNNNGATNFIIKYSLDRISNTKTKVLVGFVAAKEIYNEANNSTQSINVIVGVNYLLIS